jgi:hypothetical protein
MRCISSDEAVLMKRRGVIMKTNATAKYLNTYGTLI